MATDPFLWAREKLFFEEWKRRGKEPLDYKIESTSEKSEFKGRTFCMHMRMENVDIPDPGDSEYDGRFREIESRPMVKDENEGEQVISEEVQGWIDVVGATFAKLKGLVWLPF